MKESKQSLLKSKINTLSDIKIRPKISFSQNTINPLVELRKEKKRLFQIAKHIQLNTGISENDTQEIEYLRFQVNNYSKNFVENVQSESLKFNFEQLKVILSSSNCSFFQDLTYQQYQDMYRENPELIKECFSKYRNVLLDTLDYRSLSAQDKKLLSEFISRKEVSRSYSNEKTKAPTFTNGYAHDSTYSIFDHVDLVNNSSKNNINVVDINSMPTVNVENSRIKKLLMFNEFRLFVKNKELSDDQIDSFFRSSTDVQTAANNYFKMVNNSDKISLTYIFPNQQSKVYQFQFIDPLDYLILEVYKNHSELNSPFLMLGNGEEFSFNPIEDKCIGSIFKNGNVLYVRSR